MKLRARPREGGLRGRQRLLLREDKGVRRAVQRVVAERSQGKGAPHALVCHGQVAHAVPHGKGGLYHAPVVHGVPQAPAPHGHRGHRGEARKEWVGPLVSLEERQDLLLALDHSGRQRLQDVLAKDVVRDDGRHGPSSSLSARL